MKISDGLNVVITESDLLGYAGMYLTADIEPNSLRGLFPKYPARVQLKNDRDEEVIARADYIAKTRGTRSFPWRAVDYVREKRAVSPADRVRIHLAPGGGGAARIYAK